MQACMGHATCIEDEGGPGSDNVAMGPAPMSCPRLFRRACGERRIVGVAFRFVGLCLLLLLSEIEMVVAAHQDTHQGAHWPGQDRVGKALVRMPWT